MAQSLAKIVVHTVFSTKGRRGVLPDTSEADVYAYLGGICRKAGSHCIGVGGAEDHVHMLCTLPRTLSIAQLLNEVKVGSSKWLKAQGCDAGRFAWQGGYGAFSLGESQIAAALEYIQSQREHHRHVSFEEEFVQFLEKYNIEYDARYLWE
jgi:REP element-mobilizing transposase RayT